MEWGGVNSREPLLARSIEPQPLFYRFVKFRLNFFLFYTLFTVGLALEGRLHVLWRFQHRVLFTQPPADFNNCLARGSNLKLRLRQLGKSPDPHASIKARSSR